MSGQAGLKAGLIGAAALFILALVNILSALIPTVPIGCVCCGVQILVYAGIGVLAGFFLTPPRSAGAGAGAGAIAGALSGLGAGIGEIIAGINRLVTGLAAAQTDQVMKQLIDSGLLEPGMMPPPAAPGIGSIAINGVICCFGSLIIGAALGAIGGVIFGAAKKD